MPVKCLINCVNLMPSHRGSWRGLEQGSLRDYYLSGSYGNCRPMERRGKTKQQFSPTFPQGLENSPPKTLRISHSSHSFGYWLSICSETSQRVFRMIYFSRGRHAISKQLKPMQFLFSCNTRLCSACSKRLIVARFLNCWRDFDVTSSMITISAITAAHGY